MALLYIQISLKTKPFILAGIDKNARRLLNFFRAASGRKLCEDADKDILQTEKAYISSFTASAL